MSMENAILAHAAALSELAAAVRALVDSTMGAVVTGGERIKGTVETVRGSTAEEAAADEVPGKKSRSGNTTVAEAGNDARDESTPADSAPQNTNASDAPSDEAGEPLNYDKDVKPVLMAAIKKVGRDKVQALIASYGVEKADKIPQDKLADVLGKAQKLVA